MGYFTKDYFDFFKELAANNNKDWFNENKKRYESAVKKPFELFVDDLITSVKKIDKTITLTSKEAIFRINKDVRFSKDKTPYKTNRSALISARGRKDKSYPGLYIEISPEHCRIYGGVYMPEKDQLYNIRETIARNPKKLEKLMADPAFKKTFGKVLGEKNKVIPKEFKEAADQFDLIYNKQFYWFSEFKPAEALKDDFLKKVVDAYKSNHKLMQYFIEATP